MRFYSDEAVMSFITTVTGMEVRDNVTYLILEDSEMYPGGGGQLPDKGTIGNEEIISVFEEDGKVYHGVSDPSDFFIGMKVRLTVDREARFENSRVHTAQHIYSAVLKNGWGIKTTSFRMSEDFSTIDTDIPVTDEIIREATIKTDDVILSGIETVIHQTTRPELDKLGLGNLAAGQDTVQLIKIGDLDYSACCGTHVGNTSDIKAFAVRKWENHNKGSRIYFTAGIKARNYLLDMEEEVRNLREILMVHESEIPFQVTLLKEREEEEKKKVSEIRGKLVELMMGLPEYREEFIYQELNEDEELIMDLAGKLKNSGRDGMLTDIRELKVYGFTGKYNLNLGKFFRDTKPSHIRGGGGKGNFQGTADTEEILLGFTRTFRNKMEEYLKNDSLT